MVRRTFSQMKFEPIPPKVESCSARPVERLVLVQDKVNGNVVSKYEIKMVNPADQLRDFRPEDFSLSNLLAIGAPPTVFCQYSDTNIDSVVDNIDALSSALDRATLVADQEKRLKQQQQQQLQQQQQQQPSIVSPDNS